MSIKIKPEELLKNVTYKPKFVNWMDVPVEFRKGTFNYA